MGVTLELERPGTADAEVTNPASVTASRVHDILSAHMLADGFDLVLDLRRSRGLDLVDARDGTVYLDMFGFFASSALGMNHPALAANARFRAELTRAALNKPSNSDVYTVAMARFVDTFARVLGDPALPHLFFIDGGALAVENALKVAFDWKSRHNAMHGRPAELGTKVLHLTGAFHGRSGYTLSLTNTDPIKTERFPAFDWPRIETPICAPASTSRSPSSARWRRPGPHSPKIRTTSRVSSPSRFRARAAIGTCDRNFSGACSSCATSRTRCSSSTRCRPAWR